MRTWRGLLGEDLYRLLRPKFELPDTQYPGKVNEVRIGNIPPTGTRNYSIILGGSRDLPFFSNPTRVVERPRLAMRVQTSPADIPPTVLMALGDRANYPASWTRFCIEECGAEIIEIKFNLPNRTLSNESLKEYAKLSQQLVDEFDVPFIFSGPDVKEIDHLILEAVATAVKGERVLLASARPENDYARIAKAAIDNQHLILAHTDCDPPSQKMLNDRLLDLGLSHDQIVIDPTTAALGYGLEYSLSITEQIRLNALKGDKSLQMPIAAFPLNSWTAREANFEDARYGDLHSRGIIWELTTSLTMFLAGAELLVLLHPESVRRFKLMTKEVGLAEPRNIGKGA